MIFAYLRRGLLAGFLAGLLAGLFGFTLGEPTLDQAVELEEQSHHSEGQTGGEHGSEAPVFDRRAQKVGLFLATALYGIAVGGAFGLVSAYFQGRVVARSGWLRSLMLSVAVFAGAVLLPFLKYPPNPPGVAADPATLTDRTAAYLAMMVLSLLSAYFAWRLARELANFSTPVRHLLVGGFLAVAWGLLLLLMPGFGGAGGAPADLMWDFRLSSLGTQAVLWLGIGCAFGLLSERAETRESSSASRFSLEGEPR